MAGHDELKSVALDEYREVVAQFRILTDIRFRLLAYLPLGTVAAVVVSKEGERLVSQPAVAAFALIATICIATYNKRNDQHYDDLVARAAELEMQELGIGRGSFAQRQAEWLIVGPVNAGYGWKKLAPAVGHRWPVGLLYVSATALWTYLLVDSLVHKVCVPYLVGDWSGIGAAGVVFIVWQCLKYWEKERDRSRRQAVLELMEKLVDRKEGLNERALLDAIVARKDSLPWIELDMRTDYGQRGKGADDEKTRFARRVGYHWEIYSQGSRKISDSSALLSALVDLPSRWIEDVYSGRR